MTMAVSDVDDLLRTLTVFMEHKNYICSSIHYGGTNKVISS